MNTQRVRNALFTLLIHPEQMRPGDRADLQLALETDNPLEQGIVAEILHNTIREHVAERLR